MYSNNFNSNCKWSTKDNKGEVNGLHTVVAIVNGLQRTTKGVKYTHCSSNCKWSTKDNKGGGESKYGLQKDNKLLQVE